ncbi:MAG: PLP-dependent aminotransferase family protein [Candidatus Competibacteraceae bacterium]|nr:PLP-dependent aminotransferase family protein [Candidatus Competibacteraceae bacterium]
MTIWQPTLENTTKPRYVALADTLADDIKEGRLLPGNRLPTHRDLAEHLGVTVGTVSRAYSEAERRGLIQGEIGRGTFVRKPAESPSLATYVQEPGIIDLSANVPNLEQRHTEAMRRALGELANDSQLGDRLNYQAAEGLTAYRSAGADWMTRGGLTMPAERVLVTNGGQHALLITLMALAKPGDTVLTEKLTYPGIKAIAGNLHLNLRGLEMDAEGILPEALDSACKKGTARFLFCVPTLQNPTTATMSAARRQHIAALARTHDLTIVEDDVYGFLMPDRPSPIASYAPERTYFVTSLCKSVLPSLRVGYLAVPEGNSERFSAVIRSTVWMSSPLMTEIATRWIQNGTADELADWQHREAMARQDIAAHILHRWEYQTYSGSMHLWLTLPDPWRAHDIAQSARSRGVLLSPAATFAVARSGIPHALRICLMGPASRAQLERSLTVIAELLTESPDLCCATL